MNIQYSRKKIPEGIARLKREKNVYLYGIGEYADDMLEILNEYDIKIDGIFVSKEYLKEKSYKGILVQSYVQNYGEEYVVVAGFNVLQHGELTETLINDSNIKKIYVLNGNDIYWGNNFNFLDSKIYLVDSYYNTLLQRGLDSDYYNKNIKLFEQTYNWLSDEQSQKVMHAYLSGHINLENFPMKTLWRREDLDEQYFPKDLIRLSDNEVFVDCGAYTGDTFCDFKKRVNSFGKYYALEPDKRRFPELEKAIMGEKKVMHIPLGAWKEKTVLSFANEIGCGMVGYTEKCEDIEADAIDNIVSENEKITFIKMDIEGSELNALIGARRTLKRCRPKLAICVYHKKEDLITIPQYIKSISKGYKLYLRAHMAYAGEVVLYGIHE